MEPKNHPIEKEYHLPNLHYYSVSMLIFRGVVTRRSQIWHIHLNCTQLPNDQTIIINRYLIWGKCAAHPVVFANVCFFFVSPATTFQGETHPKSWIKTSLNKSFTLKRRSWSIGNFLTSTHLKRLWASPTMLETSLRGVAIVAPETTTGSFTGDARKHSRQLQWDTVDI